MQPVVTNPTQYRATDELQEGNKKWKPKKAIHKQEYSPKVVSSVVAEHAKNYRLGKKRKRKRNETRTRTRAEQAK